MLSEKEQAYFHDKATYLMPEKDSSPPVFPSVICFAIYYVYHAYLAQHHYTFMHCIVYYIIAKSFLSESMEWFFVYLPVWI